MGLVTCFLVQILCSGYCVCVDPYKSISDCRPDRIIFNGTQATGVEYNNRTGLIVANRVDIQFCNGWI